MSKNFKVKNGIEVATHVTASGNISSSGTGSFAYGSADTQFLQQSINTTLNSDVGAISTGQTIEAGTSIESLLRQILIDFIPPTFTNFAISNLSTRLEVGDQESNTINTGTFTTGSSASDNSGFENNGGSFQLSISNNSQGSLISGNISANYSGNAGTSNISFTSPTSVTVKKTSVGTVTFSLEGTDSNGNETTKTDTCKFLAPYFFGGSSINATTSDIDTKLDLILAEISGSNTATGLNISFTSDNNKFGQQTYINTTNTTNLTSNLTLTLPSSVADSSKFTYIIYPSGYENLTEIIQNGALPVLSAFEQLAFKNDGVNHTRFVTQEYCVYKSNLPGAFLTGDTLEIND